MILKPLTSHEAQLLLDNLNNVKAAMLPDDEYSSYWHAKYKLIDMLVDAERRERDHTTDLTQFTKAS